jgi:acetyl-CoA synthetase
MTLQIKTIEEYQKAYEKSVADPEGFWAEQASTFSWKKSGTRCLSGISKSRM